MFENLLLLLCRSLSTSACTELLKILPILCTEIASVLFLEAAEWNHHSKYTCCCPGVTPST